MKKIGGILFLSLCAGLFIGCGAPAANTGNGNSNVNSNANASKPTAAAPTADALLAMDKQANEAYFKGDTAFFQGFLSDKAVGFNHGTAVGKDTIVKEIGTAKCDMKSFNLSEPTVVKIDNDNYVLTYKGTYDGTCTENGKAIPSPANVRAATLYTRSGDKWQALWHNENAIVDPKNQPAPAKADDKKASDKKDDKPAANSNSNSNSNSTSTTAAGPAKSSNTDALVKLHQAGWDAFKAKDAKWFDANLASGMVFVDPFGTVFSSKADTIKQWTETMKCEGITKTSVTDGYSVAISPTLELFNLKGSSDGTCDGELAKRRHVIGTKEQCNRRGRKPRLFLADRSS
jgi:hypothetical protein